MSRLPTDKEIEDAVQEIRAVFAADRDSAGQPVGHVVGVRQEENGGLVISIRPTREGLDFFTELQNSANVAEYVVSLILAWRKLRKELDIIKKYCQHVSEHPIYRDGTDIPHPDMKPVADFVLHIMATEEEMP